MTHELTRAEARELGYDLERATTTLQVDQDPDNDLVDVWDQLGPAEEVEPQPLDHASSEELQHARDWASGDYDHPGEEPPGSGKQFAPGERP